MDKEGVDKEFEGLLMFNDIELEASQEDEEETAMSIAEMSSIAQDLNSMLWYMQEVMTRVFEERSVTVDSEVIGTLRKMQEQSINVIEGLSFVTEDED